MSPIAEFPLLTVFVLVVLVLFFFSMLTPRVPPRLPPPPPGRDLGGHSDPAFGATDGPAARRCAACGTDHPGYAVYCRRCGQPLT